MSEQTLTELRMKRGQEILQKGATITKIDDYSYSINSLTSNSIYEINNLENRFVCSCPDFQYREVELCKHIACLQIWLTKVEEKPKVFADDAIQCDECGSIRIVKYGFDYGKQTYYCKDCNKKFREHSILRKVKFTPELITLCLDLYFSGLSLRKISRNISDHFNVDINYSTIYDWIQTYIPQISNYVNSLTPQLSDSWHIDELFVKMKGGEKRKGNANVAYLWNVMDRESRFLIASKLSEKRDSNGAIQAINEAIHNSHGNLPQTVYTDALKGYKEGIKQTLGQNVEHIAKCGINKPH